MHATVRRQQLTKAPDAVALKGEFKCFALEDHPGWKGVAGPLIAASKPMTGLDSLFVTYADATRGLSTNLKQVASFYGQPTAPFPPSLQHVTELERNGSFADPAANQKREDARTKDMEETKLQLGNIESLQSASNALVELAKSLSSSGTDIKSTISQRLDSVSVTVTELRPGESNESPTREMTLERFIKNNGWNYPESVEDLENLAEAIITPPVAAPKYGNYAGALGWPIPLSKEKQREIHYEFLNSAENHDEYGVLGSLTKGMRWEAGELKEPDKMLKKILASPRAQALGKFIQARLGSINNSMSKNDHVLAALHISLDPSSVLNDATVENNKIAGFDLLQKDNWGLSASAIVDKFTQHLVCERIAKHGQTPTPTYIYVDGKKRASAETAPVAARLLLARHAAEFLVKNIPDSVKLGSHSWVSLKTAVARLEAQAPGATASMDYKEVMWRASTSPITPEQERTELYAQHDALKGWGMVNGFLPVEGDASENPARMKQVYEEYNAQIATLRESSNLQLSDLPDYKDLCLKVLKGILGDNVSLEKKCIILRPGHMDYVGPYSLLDLFMSQEGFTYPVSSSTATQFKPGQGEVIHRWVSTDPGINMDEVLEKIDENDTKFPDFGAVFSDFCDKYESSLRAQTRHLISQLPLEDRKNFEYGAITLHKEQRYTLRSEPKYDRANPDALIIKITRHGQSFAYELDSKKGHLIKRDLKDFNKNYSYAGNKRPLEVLIPFKLKDDPNIALGETDSFSSGTPKNFNSERSAYIGQAMAENSPIRLFEAAAKGVNSFDTQVPFYRKLNEFMLNLIPLRSAIIAFSKGNLAEGFMDLIMDAFGFAVGLGAAAKSLKGLTTLAKVGRSLRVVGRAAIGAANPFDIIPTIAKGAYQTGKFGYKGIKAAANLSGSYDLLSAARKYDGVAFGTFKVEGHIVKGDAVLTGGKWHAYDPVARQPFGTELNEFVPTLKAADPEFGNWGVGPRTLPAKDQKIIDDWEAAVKKFKFRKEYEDAFKAGYFNTGAPGLVQDKLKKLKPMELRALAQKTGLDANTMGTYMRQYDNLAFKQGSEACARFIDNIEPEFGTVFAMPQSVYLSQTAQFSNGQCAGLSRTFASAIEKGQDKVLINNLHRVAANPDLPSTRSFMNTLAEVQARSQTATQFHAQKVSELMDPAMMVNKLKTYDSTTSLMIDTPGHAMAAGVIVEGASKKFYFYDPNVGAAYFPSADAMTKGLEKLFSDKKFPAPYRTHSGKSDLLQFKVFEHDDSWRKLNSIQEQPFKALFEAPLDTHASANISHAQLKARWETQQKAPANKGLICYESSILVGQAEKNLSVEVFDAVKASTDRAGATNYCAAYLDLMGITPGSVKNTFNAADITESGLLNFKHSNEGGHFGHTVYVQKADDGQLYLFNTNSAELDAAMLKSGHELKTSAGMTVYNISNGNHKGLQNYLDGADGQLGWKFAFTPSMDMLLQRIQIERLGQDRRIARDRAVAVENFLRVAADKDHLQFGPQLQRGFGDLHPGNPARQAVVGDHQVQVWLGGQDFEGLLPIYRLQYPITQAAQVFAEHEHNG
ncbi:hypothetical protein AO262_26480, partial [Pseudomonas fluorescens ABAC62]